MAAFTVSFNRPYRAKTVNEMNTKPNTKYPPRQKIKIGGCNCGK